MSDWISRSFSLKGFGSVIFNTNGTYECIKEKTEFLELTDEKEKREFLDEFIKLKNTQSK